MPPHPHTLINVHDKEMLFPGSHVVFLALAVKTEVAFNRVFRMYRFLHNQGDMRRTCSSAQLQLAVELCTLYVRTRPCSYAHHLG